MSRGSYPIQGNVGVLGTSISSGELDASSVGSSELVDYSVIESKVATGAVTSSKLGALAVLEGKINTGAITSSKLGSLSVLEGKINTGAVSTSKLASRSVSTTKIQTGAITNNEVNDINAAKVTAGQLALARGGTGVDNSGKTVAVLEDAQTFTADQTFGDILTQNFLKITRVTFTISVGSITMTTSYGMLRTEGGAATDDLDTINVDARSFIMARSKLDAEDITYKDGTGNLSLAGDFTATSSIDMILMQRDETGNILELSRSDNA